MDKLNVASIKIPFQKLDYNSALSFEIFIDFLYYPIGEASKYGWMNTPENIANYNEFYYEYVNYVFSQIKGLKANPGQTMLDAFIKGFKTVMYFISSNKQEYLKKLNDIKESYDEQSPEVLKQKAEKEMYEKLQQTAEEKKFQKENEQFEKNSPYTNVQSTIEQSDTILNPDIEYFTLVRRFKNDDPPPSFMPLGKYLNTSIIESGGHGHVTSTRNYFFKNNKKGYATWELYVQKENVVAPDNGNDVKPDVVKPDVVNPDGVGPENVGGKYKKQTKKSKKSKKSKKKSKKSKRNTRLRK